MIQYIAKFTNAIAAVRCPRIKVFQTKAKHESGPTVKIRNGYIIMSWVQILHVPDPRLARKIPNDNHPLSRPRGERSGVRRAFRPQTRLAASRRSTSLVTSGSRWARAVSKEAVPGAVTVRVPRRSRGRGRPQP